MAAVSRLVRWLPKAVEATADDIARFGPQAGRVRQLLDFLPTMSREAAAVSRKASNITSDAINIPTSMAEDAGRYQQFDEAADAGWDFARHVDPSHPFRISGYDAAAAESVSDLIDPDSYRALTSPLAAGRAVDLLRARPRYQGTPFLDVVQNLAGRGAITGPRDVVRAGRIARAPEDVREIALTLIADGMDPADALRAARML